MLANCDPNPTRKEGRYLDICTALTRTKGNNTIPGVEGVGLLDYKVRKVVMEVSIIVVPG